MGVQNCTSTLSGLKVAQELDKNLPVEKQQPKPEKKGAGKGTGVELNKHLLLENRGDKKKRNYYQERSDGWGKNCSRKCYAKAGCTLGATPELKGWQKTKKKNLKQRGKRRLGKYC